MADTYFFKAEKLKQPKLKPAAKHNKREIQAELGARGHIDPMRTRFNFSLIEGVNCADDVVNRARALLLGAGIKKPKRVDAVYAIEALFSLPANSGIDPRAYFADCLAWIRDYLNCPILAADVHLDEAAPHCHILILPLINGKLNGGRLYGHKPVFDARNQAFYEAVAMPYGLAMPVAKLSGQAKRNAYQQVIDCLNERNDPVLKSQVWALVQAAVRENPANHAQALGLTLHSVNKPTKWRSSTAIMTSKGKGGRVEKTSARCKPMPTASPKPASEPIRLMAGLNEPMPASIIATHWGGLEQALAFLH